MEIILIYSALYVFFTIIFIIYHVLNDKSETTPRFPKTEDLESVLVIKEDSRDQPNNTF